MNLRRRWVVLIAICLLAILGVAYFILNNPAHIAYYWLADDRTLMLEVTSGPGADVHLSSVVEAANSVTVTVIAVYFSGPLPQTAEGYSYEVAAHLTEPLHNRVVVDGSDGLALDRVACPPSSLTSSPCP